MSTAEATQRKIIPWETEEDETFVLFFISEIEKGANASQAFKTYEASINGKRTFAAAAFRWNQVLSKNPDNKEMYEKAKLIGKGKKYNSQVNIHVVPEQPKQPQQEIQVNEPEVFNSSKYAEELQQATGFIESAIAAFSKVKELESQLAQANKQITILTKRNEELESDVNSFSQIFNRAREIAVNAEFQPSGTTKFKMERNGNLVPKE